MNDESTFFLKESLELPQLELEHHREHHMLGFSPQVQELRRIQVQVQRGLMLHVVLLRTW
jgi:hypothetical protein